MPKIPRLFRKMDKQKPPQFSAKWIQHKIHSPRHSGNVLGSRSKNPQILNKMDSCKKPKILGFFTKMGRKPKMCFLLRLRICSHPHVLGFICAFEFPRSLLCNNKINQLYHLYHLYIYIYLSVNIYIYIHIRITYIKNKAI